MCQRSWGVIVVILSVLISGCASVTTRWEDRARVDQDIPGMPAGPLKTRKVLVVEVTEKTQNADTVLKVEEKETDIRSRQALPEKQAQAPAVPQSHLVLPEGRSSATFDAQTVPGAQKYTVEKDDTLQKISKKFYGVYSRWTVIYDANKDVIKNPNFLKPGIVLQIPTENKKETAAPPTE